MVNCSAKVRNKESTMPQLRSVKIEGFRSIERMELQLRPINICIGANGAGKSNLIAFFKLINELMGGRLQQYIATTGRATGNLYFGPKSTPQFEAQMKFEAENGTDAYRIRMFHAAGDSLIFAEETVSFHQAGYPTPKRIALGAGHQEGKIVEADDPVTKTVRHFLNHCRVYHFHDTSQTARIRQYCYVEDHRWLMPDAANLAAVLYRLKSDNEVVYRRIVRNVTQVAPFFVDFDLQPTGLNRTEIGRAHG